MLMLEKREISRQAVDGIVRSVTRGGLVTMNQGHATDTGEGKRAGRIPSLQ